MKRNLLTIAFGLLVASMTGQQAQAVTISGDIDFAGGVNYNTNSLATATQVNSFISPVVSGRSGDFNSVALNAPVTFTTPYVLNSGADVQLWTVGGFTFTLDNSNILIQSPTLLHVTGNGFLTAAGFDRTPGLWSWTSSQANGSTSEEFSFSSNTTATPGQVPEGGSAIALLGMALMGLEGLRRKLAIKNA